MCDTGSPDLLTFPPVPLASGTVLVDAQGNPQQVRTVTVVVVTEDGARHQVELRYEHGGWWPPLPSPRRGGG